MAEDRSKPALSLNQLHNRRFFSASQSIHTKPVVDFESDIPQFNFNSSSPAPPVHVGFDTDIRDDDIPRFNFESPSPPVPVQETKVEISVSKTKSSSPQVFAGVGRLDSPSPSTGRGTSAKKSASKTKGSSSRLIAASVTDLDSPSTDHGANAKESVSKTKGSSSQMLAAGVTDLDSPSPYIGMNAMESVSKTKGSSSQWSAGLTDLGPPSTSIGMKAKESVSKTKGSSPQVFAGVTDFDSPSTVLDADLNEDGETTEEHDKVSEINSALPFSSEYNHSAVPISSEYNPNLPGEERETKVRIEGRRRLCKISKKKDDGAENENYTRQEEPLFDDLADFESPLPVKKSCEDSGNEIRDILSDLSSRLEILSIEKRPPPKKTNFTEGVKEPVRSATYDMPKKEANHDQKVNFLSKYSSSIEVQNDGYVGKASKTMTQMPSKNKSTKAHFKSGTAKEFNAYNFLTEGPDSSDNNYKFSTEKKNFGKVDKKQGKLIEISDDESETSTVPNVHVDDFLLSGPKGTYKLSAKIANMLFPHQREGLKWLWSLHCKGKGGILGDDMGLGKTMQMCGFLVGLFRSNLVKRVLVVAPRTLLAHWTKELSVVGLSHLTRDYSSTCIRTRDYELQYVIQDKGILLTTYDIVRNNTNALCGNNRYQDDEDENLWDYMILDEGHLIKNPSTQRAKSLLQIPCLHRIIISGTPLQNNLKELWALFSFCCPELLGDKKEFKEKYEYFINRGNEKNASDREKRIGSSVAKDLRDCIQPYFLRRLKSEVFGDNSQLSKKDELIVWLKLTRCQRKVYEAFLKSEIVLSACDGSPLAALTILKKICDHPLLLTKRAAEDVLEGMESMVNQEDQQVAEKLAMHIADVAERFDIVDSIENSCKLSFILSLLGDLIPKGHNVLIFSQTRKMLNLIQESLAAHDYEYMRIDGTTKTADRAKIVKEFQEGHGAPIFLLTTQVGGLGLTLTNADRVIVVDPAWNPSTDNQSVDRAYRIGQKKDVVVYRLMTCSTVEEKIYKKQVYKGGLFRSATEHKEQTRYFSQQDLHDLFSLPQQGFDISLTQQQLLEEHDRQHTMEESLRAHVEFLETLNIAGVSHHSLLFSKTTPVQELAPEEEVEKLRGRTFPGNASNYKSTEREVHGAEYAFKPKDAKKLQKSPSPDVMEPTEDDIREKISRYTRILANKTTVSNLPDKGENIQKKILALNHQLNQMRLEKELNQMRLGKGNRVDVIDV